MSDKTKKFVQGAFLLSVAGIVTKLINMFFKVPLQALIGDEGLAYYYNPYPIYTLFIAIFITGISSAMSKMVSEKLAFNKYREAHTIFKNMFLIFIILGTISSVILFLFAKVIVDKAAWDPGTIYALQAMSVTPIILAVIGAIRGYFQGMQNMLPSAFSQIFESIGKVIIGIGLVVLLLDSNKDISVVAGGAAVGLTVGTFLSMLYLLFIYFKKRKGIITKVNADKSSVNISLAVISKSIILVAIPIAIGAACYTMMNFIDSFTIVRKLISIGLDYPAANELVGQKIKADTFINIPMVLSVSLVISILPAISEAVALKDHDQLIEKIDIATKLAYLIALPASVGIFILSEPLLKLFFFSDPSGSGVLSIYSFSILFVIMAQTYTAVLQGTNKIYSPLFNLILACVLKLSLNMLLINNTLGINGAVISSVIAYALLAVLNYFAVYRHTSYKVNRKLLLKGLVSTILMGIGTYLTYLLIGRITDSSIIIILISITIGVFIYGILIILTRALNENDYKYIPYGDKVYEKVNAIFYKK